MIWFNKNYEVSHCVCVCVFAWFLQLQIDALLMTCAFLFAQSFSETNFSRTRNCDAYLAYKRRTEIIYNAALIDARSTSAISPGVFVGADAQTASDSDDKCTTRAPCDPVRGCRDEARSATIMRHDNWTSPPFCLLYNARWPARA